MYFEFPYLLVPGIAPKTIKGGYYIPKDKLHKHYVVFIYLKVSNVVQTVSYYININSLIRLNANVW